MRKVTKRLLDLSTALHERDGRNTLRRKCQHPRRLSRHHRASPSAFLDKRMRKNVDGIAGKDAQGRQFGGIA